MLGYWKRTGSQVARPAIVYGIIRQPMMLGAELPFSGRVRTCKSKGAIEA